MFCIGGHGLCPPAVHTGFESAAGISGFDLSPGHGSAEEHIAPARQFQACAGDIILRFRFGVHIFHLAVKDQADNAGCHDPDDHADGKGAGSRRGS